MDPLGLKPYGSYYTRLYNLLLSIIVLCLALSLLFFVAALFSPHDVQVVEVNKSIALWNEKPESEDLKSLNFRIRANNEELWMHWTGEEQKNFSERISQMSDLSSYNASYFAFDDPIPPLYPPTEFSEVSSLRPSPPSANVSFELAINSSDYSALSPILNVSLWKEAPKDLQCEDHCSTVCRQQGGVWRDNCVEFFVVDAVCVIVSEVKSSWKYASGCYGLHGYARYRHVVPGSTESFTTIRFEVRSENDPFIKAVLVTNAYAEFAPSPAVFGKASLFFLSLFLILLAVLVIGVNHAKRADNQVQDLNLSVSSVSDNSSASFKL